VLMFWRKRKAMINETISPSILYVGLGITKITW